jgi:FkbM family methyltransferase
MSGIHLRRFIRSKGGNDNLPTTSTSSSLSLSNTNEQREDKPKSRNDNSKLIFCFFLIFSPLAFMTIRERMNSTCKGHDTIYQDEKIEESDVDMINTNFHGSFAQSSPFTIDCQDRIVNNANENMGGVWVPTREHAAPSFQMNIHEPEQDSYVSGDIEKDGCFECHILNNLLSFVKFKASEDAFLLDIGGNIGLYSLSVAAMGKDAYAFEPFKKNQNRLCSTMVLNKFDTLITMFGVALSDKETILDLQTQKIGSNFGAVSIDPSKSAEKQDGEKYVDYTPVTKLDDIANYLPEGRPVVMKVDVEGAECDALSGAFDYLLTLKIEYVAIEWSYGRLKECKNRDKIFELFEDKNGLTPYMARGDEFDKLSTSEVNGAEWKQRGNIPNVGLYDIIWSKEHPSTYVTTAK